ncbi:hypothetical protein NQ317_015420 [Molorchus minor]|uniref:Autophagy-related protein 2 n=1 Tax=Molorchus minor TaxID=1323400 RepID=A0ABQ9IX14_9CUCU|nr:hypothetical protein NQ317_015420 [Molorchus minor]
MNLQTLIFESIWNSMTSSMQLAYKNVRKNRMLRILQNTSHPYEGIELFAIEYSDEAGDDPPGDETTDLTSQDSKKVILGAIHCQTKKFILQGVTLSTIEFVQARREHFRDRSYFHNLSHLKMKKRDSAIELIQKTTVNDIQDDKDNKSENGERTPTDEKKNSAEIPNELNGHRHVILFGKFSSKQSSQKMLLDQSFHRSKFGIPNTILITTSISYLVELANGIASPDIEDNSNVAHKPKCSAKAMSGLDYQRVEQELQQQLQPFPNFQAGGLQGAHGWSSGAVDESDTEENFLPMKNAMSGMYDSTLSGISSSMDSSVSSSMASSVTEQNSDPTAEISHFQIRLSSLAVLLLHEDLLVNSPDSHQILAPSSVHQMQQTAEGFFNKMGHFVFSAYGNKDFENAKTAFENACDMNHIRLLATPVQVEGDEKTTLSAFSITGSLSVAKMEVLECLYSKPEKTVEYVPLLTFTDAMSLQTSTPNTAKPSLKLNFKHMEKTGRNGAPRRSSIPRTDVILTLNKCSVDFDISIVDRITALLNHPDICVVDKPPYNPWNTNTIPEQLQMNGSAESRFPIPDFRPPHDLNRVPWWKRHVRPDYLSLMFSDATFQKTFQPNQAFEEYNIQARGLNLKAGFEEKPVLDALLQLRLHIKMYPAKSHDLDECMENEQDPMTTSFYGAFENQSNKQPGPFSAKKVVHESDTPHGKPQRDDAEELIIPGDKHEINEFMTSTIESCKVHVEVFLPSVSIQLATKHIYELIYNRINNDLLLWEPSAPKSKTNIYENPTYNYAAFGRNVIIDGQETFAMCKSGIQYESDSDSDELEGSGCNVFYSTYEKSTRFAIKQQHLSENLIRNRGQTNLILDIQIGQGLLCMNCPVRDVSTNNVIPGQQGEFLINFENGNIFIVNGYKADPNLGYVCVQVHTAQLYHCDMTSIPSLSQPLKEIGTTTGRHLHPTIYKSGVWNTCKRKG